MIVAAVAFADRNANGVRDPGEPLVPDVVLDLTRSGYDGAGQST